MSKSVTEEYLCSVQSVAQTIDILCALLFEKVCSTIDCLSNEEKEKVFNALLRFNDN